MFIAAILVGEYGRKQGKNGESWEVLSYRWKVGVREKMKERGDEGQINDFRPYTSKIIF